MQQPLLLLFFIVIWFRDRPLVGYIYIRHDMDIIVRISFFDLFADYVKALSVVYVETHYNIESYRLFVSVGKKSVHLQRPFMIEDEALDVVSDTRSFVITRIK